MKPLIVTSVIMLACVSGEAMAAPNCLAVNRIINVPLTTLITGNTICVPPNGPAPFQWQEQHVSGGELRDSKQGPNDPVDPTTQVGTWSIARNLVTYNYGGGGTFTYTVHTNGDGTHSFCTSGTTTVKVVGKFKTGLVGCP